MSERKGTKALELWCKRLVKDCPSVHIDNMTTSWRDGIAFCALVHHFRPDLIDMSMLKAENIYENNQLAFSVAEKHLGIPALLDAEDMVENDVPDRLSILTYLSQFYQRLGHKVNTKVSENDSKSSLSPTVPEPTAPISFGKTGLDKCTACSLPVYLAQRLLVSHKLYHRRCFRCSKCSGHLNPKNYHVISGSELSCDSCKNEKTLSKFLNNNDHDQMGMLAFNDMSEKTIDKSNKEPISLKQKTRPQSIMDKINMFEKNIENVDNKVMNLTLKDNVNIRHSNEISSTSAEQIDTGSIKISPDDLTKTKHEDALSYVYNKPPEKEYKSNIEKFNFMQTQLSNDMEKTVGSTDVSQTNHNENNFTAKDILSKVDIDKEETKDKDIPKIELTAESNITDDIRLANSHNTAPNLTNSLYSPVPVTEHKNDDEIKISVPPRRKKQHAINVAASNKKKEEAIKPSIKVYPDNLNPFSDDDEEEPLEKVSTNPFGSSDEEDDKILPILPSPKTVNDTSTPVKRLITVNPFWSDGEEPSSDEESNDSSMNKSSLTTSTPNLPSSMRRTKAKAPPPPPPAAPPPIPYPAPTPSPAHTSTPAPLITVSEHPSTSMDDVASISSLSSYNSTIHSDQKSFGGATPLFKKKRLAPTPPDSLSTVSGYGGSLEKGIDSSGILSNTSASDCGSRRKGPAPGLPLPERREVKLQMSPQELQVQLDLLETQQLGLERQGVLIERMIRDKCEGDEGMTAPQEEVEDLVIQLCELVNEKNDLFRKQTELMYIRRQQRLEQEQADIEHEIRVIQSRPAVNRIDADKAREEQLVGRLVEIVRMRDELVQQLDAERRRERQEDLAIAASIANKRAQRNSESNSSSIKSLEVATTPKKNKVKDKVKKQLKKAKHSLIYKKKEDSERKEDKPEKEKKTK